MRSINFSLIAWLLGGGIATAQVVEDFKCTVPLSISNGNPAIVTCGEPHGWNQRALNLIQLWAAGTNGDTITIDGTTYTLVTTLNNNIPNQVLIGQTNRDTAWNLYLAINRGNANMHDGYMAGVLYSSATVENPSWGAAMSWQSYGMQVLYKTAGPTGIGKSMSSSNANTATWETPASRMEWWVLISGASGCWAGQGTNCGGQAGNAGANIGAGSWMQVDPNRATQVPHFYRARYVDATHFSLWLNAVYGFDTTYNGPYTGQQLTIGPSGPDGSPYPQIATQESWSVTGGPASSDLYQVNVPGCPNPDHELECSQARRVPETCKNGNGIYSHPASFTISGGVATITFATPFPYAPNSSGNMKRGENIWLRNFVDTPGAWTHTITKQNVANAAGLGTQLNQLVRYTVGAETVQALANSETGGAIGVCTANCGTTGTATIADAGKMPCVFDNAYTTGHFVTMTAYDSRCHDAGANWINSGWQTVGVVVDNSGAAGTTGAIWWNGLNRAYKVQSVNGPGDGTGVTQITLNIPGYPDGNYNNTRMLPGIDACLVGDMLTAFVDNRDWISPYVIFPASYVGGYQYPLFSRIMKDQGNFDAATSNRLSFWVKWNKSQQQCGINSGALSIGSYFLWPQTPAGAQGDHYYNDADPEQYAGQWMRYDVTRDPSHKVGIGSAYNFPDNLMMQGAAGGWHGQSNFFDRLGTFYLDLSGIFCPPPRNVTGQTIYVSPLKINTAAGEPEELVRLRFGSWSPALFQAGDMNGSPTGPPGYSLTWSGELWGVGPVQYEVRYSTWGSLKTLGFSNGLCQNGTTTCGVADHVTSDGITKGSILYHSASMTQQPNIWWGIKPISIPVSSASGSGQNPTWIITPMDPGFQSGDHVTVTGVGVIPNQTNIATSAVLKRQLWSRFDARPSALGGISYPANPGGPVKINVYINHGLLTGQTIQLGGPAGYSLTPSSLAGQYTVTVLDGYTFTLDGTSYDAMCPCSGGMFRLNLPGNLTSITTNGTASPNTVCTVNLTVPHNLVAGWKVDIIGAPESHISYSDGYTPMTFTVTNIGSSTSFDFTCPAGTPINATFNTDLSPGSLFLVQSWFGLAVPVTGTGTYTSGGTVYSTEDNRNFAEIQLWPYNTTPTALSQRFGGASTSTAVVLLYDAPDSGLCTVSLTGSGLGTGTTFDTGGEQARFFLWSGLSPGTAYQFTVSCGQAMYVGSGTFTTPQPATPAQALIQVAAAPPAIAVSADNLVVDYGPGAGMLNQSVNAGCSPGGRCSATLTPNLDSAVWVRRRWCINRASDPGCSIPANEVARSTPEVITVR